MARVTRSGTLVGPGTNRKLRPAAIGSSFGLGAGLPTSYRGDRPRSVLLDSSSPVQAMIYEISCLIDNDRAPQRRPRCWQMRPAEGPLGGQVDADCDRRTTEVR